MKKYINQIIEAVCGILLMLAPFQLFKVCTKCMPNGNPMGCYYSGKLVVWLGLLITLAAIYMIKNQSKAVHLSSQIIIFVSALMCYLLPKRIIEVGHMKQDGWQIGLCHDPSMACNHTFMPFVTKIVLVLLVVSLVEFILKTLSEN